MPKAKISENKTRAKISESTVYIYIYIYRKRERERVTLFEFVVGGSKKFSWLNNKTNSIKAQGNWRTYNPLAEVIPV